MHFLCTARRLALILLMSFPVSSFAQTFTTLATFNAYGGYDTEYGGLTQGRDGNLYGIAGAGGATGNGMVFKITPEGVLTDIHDFCLPQTNPCTDGYEPSGTLLLGTDGNFYGTTFGGGVYDAGTVFKVTASGELTTLYNFCDVGSGCSSGSSPDAGLVQAVSGALYGTTAGGGSNLGGSIFRITPLGVFSQLYSFCAQAGCKDGKMPVSALAVGTDGNLYGTTDFGGTNNGGTLFKISERGEFAILHSFCDGTGGAPACADGDGPQAGLILGSNGLLYGTTIGGGAPVGGTVFSIREDGAETAVYSVCRGGCPGGYAPMMALVQASDGNLYGSTEWGYTDGSLFEVSPSGTFTTLYLMPSTSGEVTSALLQSTNGKFYGTSLVGGMYPLGTIFALDTGLGPFVTFVRRWGRVGQTVEILGQGLRGTTAVAFNGVPAEFTLRSDTFLTATIPPTATTGPVTVTTQAGTLISNVQFNILH